MVMISLIQHDRAQHPFMHPKRFFLAIFAIASLVVLGIATASWWDVAPVQAVTGSAWQVAWKSTGVLSDLEALSENVIIGVGSEGMVVKSADGGTSWHYQSIDPKFDLYAVDFVDQKQGFAVGEGGVIFRTTDGGETWLPGNTYTDEDLLALFMLNASEGWAAGRNGVLAHTEDGGNVWTIVSSGVQVDLYDLVFADANLGWAVGDGGVILHTADGGATWQRQSIPVQTDLRGVTFENDFRGWAVGSNGVILSTTNGGGQWLANTDTGFPKGTFQDVDCAAGVCYVVGDNGATLRYDGSWTRFFDLNDANRTLYAVIARDKRRAWSGGVRHTEDVEFSTSSLEYDVWSVYFTDNGGSYWRLKMGDLFPRFRKLHFVNDQEGYVVGGDWSYRRTTDGGKTWTQYQAQPPDKKEHQFYYDIDCLDVDNCFIVGRFGVVRRTRNGGVTWQDQGIIDSPTGIGRGYGKFLYSVAFQDDLNALAGGSYRLFFTDDGYHWRRASTASGNVFDIELIGATDGMATTSTGYILRRRSDGSWSQQNTYQSSLKFYGLDIMDDDGDGRLNKAWLVGCANSACDQAAVILTTNGGATWERINNLPSGAKLSDISMANAQTGWAVGDDGVIFYTVDGGFTWTRQFSPVNAHLESVQALSPDRAFASGWDGVILRYGAPAPAFKARPHSYLAVVDGLFDDWGQDVVMRIDALLAYAFDSHDGQPPASDDISASLRVRWQEDALFLAVDVRDDEVVPEEDAVSIAVDGLNDNLWGDDDLEFSVYADGELDAEAEGVTAAARTTDDGYRVEVAIHADLLGNHLAVGRSVGLNLALEDVDGDGSDARLVWSAPSLSDAPDRFADIQLAPFDDIRRPLTAFAANGQVVDGNLDDWDDLGLMRLDWDAADTTYGQPSNARADVQMQWQPQGLLGAIRVYDDDVTPEDRLIIALDGDDDGRRASAADPVVPFSPDGALDSITDVVSFVSSTQDGYAIEFFIPTHVLGGQMTHGRRMGVNVSLMDASSGGESSLIVWEGATPAGNFGDFGQLRISDRLLTLQMGRDGFTGVEDTYIDIFNPTDNFASAPVHRWRGDPNKSTLIRFDMDSFPADAIATGGTLAFRVLTDGDEEMVASAYALARDWDVNAASWAFAQPGVRWQVAGAQGSEDRVEPATDVEPLTGPGWIRFDVGNDIIRILNQGAENRGWLIEPTGAFSEYQVAASEYPTPSDRPILTIRYVLPVAEQPTATPTPTPTPTITPTPTPMPFYLPIILRSYDIPPIMLPDLTPLGMSIETEQPLSCTDPAHPAILGVRARFVNQGLAAAGAFLVDVNGVRVESSGLDAGEEGSVWTPGFAVGVNTMIVDADNRIVEIHEQNNQLSETLPIPTPLPTCTP